jgi:hypothetical protein
LDDGESFLRPVIQIADGVLAVQPVKQFPSRVTKIEERQAVGIHQITVVLAYLELKRRHRPAGQRPDAGGKNDQGIFQCLDHVHTSIAGALSVRFEFCKSGFLPE